MRVGYCFEARMAGALPTGDSRSKLFSICEVRPYLYIAGYGALSHKKVKDLGITHAIDATNLLKSAKTDGVEYMEVKVDDNEAANLAKYFDEAAQFVQRAKDSSGKVLVYCAAGISRSAALCFAALMQVEHLTLKQAYVEVGKVRPIISPNLGFWRQLIEYEARTRGENSVNLIKGTMSRSVPDVYLQRSSLFGS